MENQIFSQTFIDFNSFRTRPLQNTLMKTSTNLSITFILYFVIAHSIFAQNTKVVNTTSGVVIDNTGGLDIPHSSSILDIRSTNKGVLFPRMSNNNRNAIGSPQAGLMIYNSTTNQFNYHNGSSWQVASLGNQWGVNGSILHHGGQVGIGTSAMINSNTFLTVRGASPQGGANLEGMYVDASSTGIKPFYGYSLNDSSVAYHYFDGTMLKWALSINGKDKLIVDTTGNLEAMGDMVANGDVSVSGNLTVNNGKGIIQNISGTGQLKYYTRESSFMVSMGAFATSGEGTINFPTPVFTVPPSVSAGNIVTGSCSAGQKYNLQLVIYDCTVSNCKVRIINNSNNAVNCTITWNVQVIGY